MPIELIFGTCLIDTIGSERKFWLYLIIEIGLMCVTWLIDGHYLKYGRLASSLT